MANTRNGNTFYVDTQYSVAADEFASKLIRVSSVIVTATAASAVLVLKDSSLATKIDLRVATSGATEQFDFDPPLVFSTSIRPTTLTNAVATVVFQETK